MSDGVLYVEILPSTRGIGKAVEKGLDGQFKTAEKSGEGFFSKVGKWAKGGAIAIGAMVGTVGALAAKGGISRALNIEDATAKLKGLGHDAKSVEAVMRDALASVKGTAFGLDSAATTAAAAVASGIKPGKQLESYLKLTADAATIAGVSMDEMGSIMNKVQAKGKAQMEDLNRLTERGIPIMQMLADEYGVTAEEMSKMVSKGEVDSERFRKALENNVGGAALESGNTTRGAFSNMMAALSRLGLVFVEDGLGGAKTFFNEVTVILDGLAERFRPWVAKIKESLGDALNPEGMGEGFLSGFDRLVDAIQSGPIPQLLSALKPVLPALAEAAEIIGGALGDAFFEIGEALAPVLPMLGESLANAVVELAPSLTDLLVALIPLIPPLVELLAALAPIATDIVALLVPALEWLAALLTDNADAINLFIGFMQGDFGLPQFGALLLGLSGPFGEFLNGFASMAGAVVNWGVTIGEWIGRAVSAVTAFPGKVKTALSDAGSWLVQTGRDMIQGLIGGVREMVDSAVQAVKDVGGSMLAGVKDFLGIHSPSRVFRDQVGKMVGLGLLEGVGDDAINGRIDTAVDHMVSVPEIAGTARAGTTVNQTNTFQQMDPGIAIKRTKGEIENAMEGV